VGLTAALLAAALPLDFLLGHSVYWDSPTGDLAEHVVGGRYFLADRWRFPILRVPSLGFPGGVNIGLTDSIPLAALVAKLLRGVTAGGGSYISVWMLACYALQGPAFALGLSELGVRRIAGLVLGGLIGLFTPVLLFRFGHAALCGQFLLLLAVALHLRLIRRWQTALLLLYLPLLLAALLVHIYLFAMLAALLLASLLHGLWADALTLRAALANVAAVALVIAAMMWVCGYFEVGAIPVKPYGYYALNLAAPVRPGPSGLLRIAAPPLGPPGEDFAYLGGGMLALVAVAAIAWRQRLARLAAENLPTLLVCGLLVLFALTYGVYLGPVLLLGIAPDTARAAALGHADAIAALVRAFTAVDWLRIALYPVIAGGLAWLIVLAAWRGRRWRFLIFLGLAVLLAAGAVALRPGAVAVALSNFPASSRFVWVVIYLAELLACAGVWRAFRPAVATALLAAALVLQIADTAPLWQAIRDAAQLPPAAMADQPILGAAIAASESVLLAPSFLCAYAEPVDMAERDRLIARIQDIQVLASRWQRPINSVHQSRLAIPHRSGSGTDTARLAAACAGQDQAAAAALLHPGSHPRTMLLVLDGAPAQAGLRAELLQRPDCRALAIGVLCLARAGDE
jgi:hypothetical protein